MITRSCPECGGEGETEIRTGELPPGMGGIEPIYTPVVCEQCGGDGEIQDPEYSPISHWIEDICHQCSNCKHVGTLTDISFEPAYAGDEEGEFTGFCRNCGEMEYLPESVVLAITEDMDEPKTEEVA